jgi:hypothetical protein
MRFGLLFQKWGLVTVLEIKHMTYIIFHIT